MRRSRFSEEQVIGILKEHQAGRGVAELCRKYGISNATFLVGRKEHTQMKRGRRHRSRFLRVATRAHHANLVPDSPSPAVRSRRACASS